MAFIDWIKNRGGQQPAVEQQSRQQQKPEVSQDLSAKPSQEQTARPADLVRPEQQSRLAEAQALYRKGTKEISQTTSAPTPAPEGGTTNPQPMRQAMSGQEKVAPDMSPTSAQRSARAEEVEGPSAPAQTPSQSQRQTIARPAPSWER